MQPVSPRPLRLDTEHLVAPPIDTGAAVEGSRAAHARLLASLGGLDDAVAAAPSRLPGWTVGHVVTHLARQADSHVRLLEGAGAGQVVDQYEGGPDGRAAEIDAGAGRPAAELVADLAAANQRLEAAWDAADPAVWLHGFGRNTFGELLSCADLPYRRWREVEVHHADLGLDFGPEHWSPAYVDAELPRTLAGLPARLSLEDRRQLLAWLMGRAADPPTELPPW
ncbi:MAG TPA: maleylpyruvate isomerase N-terminal domain-containing protein [Acidimicrobiales bacterium]|nr:maleylpyruvate isomerase N-terminal domain-containing protein [Acidimicrobiales bacterium]